MSLSIDASLWGRVKAGDDCLLFRANDFNAPDRSQAFRLIASNVDSRLRAIIGMFAQLSKEEVTRVPPLEDGSFGGAVARRSASTNGSWIGDHINADSLKRPVPGPRKRAQNESADPSWVIEFLDPAAAPQDARFLGPVGHLRMSLALSALAVLLLVVAGVPLAYWSGLMVCAAVANLAYVWHQFLKEPGLSAAAENRAVLAQLDARSRVGEQNLEELKRRADTRISARDKVLEAIREDIRSVDVKATVEIEARRGRLDATDVDLQKQRRAIDQEEQTAIRNIANTLGKRVDELQQRRQSLISQHQAELSRTLTRAQESFVANCLTSNTIARAQFEGIGPKLKATLAQHGFMSAQEVQRGRVGRVPGFGPSRVRQLQSWARDIERSARSRVPSSLPSWQVQQIAQTYAERVKNADTELGKVLVRRRDDEAAVGSRAADSRENLAARERDAQNAAQRDMEDLERAKAERIAQLRQKEQQILAGAKPDIESIEAKIHELNRAAFKLQWERSRLARNATAYAALTFVSHLRYVLVGQSKRS